MAKAKLKCLWCDQDIKELDIVALNRKLFGEGITQFYCRDHLSEQLECSSEDLDDMIQKYKEEGCTLF